MARLCMRSVARGASSSNEKARRFPSSTGARPVAITTRGGSPEGFRIEETSVYRPSRNTSGPRSTTWGSRRWRCSSCSAARSVARAGRVDHVAHERELWPSGVIAGQAYGVGDVDELARVGGQRETPQAGGAHTLLQRDLLREGRYGQREQDRRQRGTKAGHGVPPAAGGGVRNT